MGKSSLINNIIGDNVSKTGSTQTTIRPISFELNNSKLKNIGKLPLLWDLPGINTKKFPSSTYFKNMRLKDFDGVIIVSCQRLTETELIIKKELDNFGVPNFIVRTKIDQDIINEKYDNNLDKDTVINKIREEYKTQDINKIYIICNRPQEFFNFDFD